MCKVCWKIVVALLYVISFVDCGRAGSGVPRIPPAASEPDTVVSKESDEPAKLKLKFEPYGVLWSAAAYESSRTNAGDYAFYVISPDAEGEAAFHMDAKSSRLGLRMLGPDICFFGCGAAGGLIEIDFQGSFVTENKPGPLLRHAYWEIDGESFRILGGQTCSGARKPGEVPLGRSCHRERTRAARQTYWGTHSTPDSGHRTTHA